MDNTLDVQSSRTLRCTVFCLHKRPFSMSREVGALPMGYEDLACKGVMCLRDVHHTHFDMVSPFYLGRLA